MSGPPGVNVGERLGRYLIEAAIGKGGMGEVYRALDTQLERIVALKTLRQDRDPTGEALARFIREAKLGARLSHGNTVQVFDSGVIDGTPFIAMEYLEGGSLAERGFDKSTSTALKIKWLADAARGLSAAHALGVLHRDMKPHNVMISRDGTAKVSDFGLGKRTETDAVMRATFRTQLGFVVGTPKFMAPEQVEGREVDSRADQFAWALTAYYVLTRRHPRDGDPLLVLAPPLVNTIAPDVPRKVAAAVNRALTFERTARFSDMAEIALILSEAASLVDGDGKIIEPKPSPIIAIPNPQAASRPPTMPRPFGPQHEPPPVQVIDRSKPPAVVVRPTVNGVVIEPLGPENSRPPVVAVPPHLQQSGVVEKNVSHWHFQHRVHPCPIAPLVAAAVARDGRTALAVSPRGIARFEGGVWNPLAGMPPLPVDSVTAINAARDGSFAFAGARGTAFTIDPNLRAKKWLLDLSNADRVTLLGVHALDAEHAYFAGVLGGEGVLVICGTSGSTRVVRCKKPLNSVRRRGESLLFCGPRGIAGRYDPNGEITFFETVGGGLSAITATKYGVFASGQGGWAVRYDERNRATIERVETVSALGLLTREDGSETLWAGSSNGRFLRREGETWKRKSPDFPVALRALALWASGERLTAVCEDGGIVSATPIR